MRIKVSHQRTRQEAMKIVDETFDQVLKPQIPVPIRIVEVQKTWAGPVMSFSLGAGMGSLVAPLRGQVEVTDEEVVFDVELPAFLRKLVPERAFRKSVETKVRGLLR